MTLPEAKPDYYRGSIVNLMASLTQAMGLPGGAYTPLAALPVDRVRRYRHVVLMIIDGLGYEYLQRFRESACYAHCQARMTSVFPTTTASAITSYYTGVAPQQHAIPGWFTYLKELGSVAAVLPFQPRGGNGCYSQYAGAHPRQILKAASLWHSLNETPTSEPPRHYHLFNHASISDSVYSETIAGQAQRHPYSDLTDMFSQMQARLRSASPAQCLVAYWSELDRIGHSSGMESEAARQHFLQLDGSVAEFAAYARRQGALVIVSADHGLIDTSEAHTLYLDDYPELYDCLSLPLCGEPRVAYCYVQGEAHQRFPQLIQQRLGEFCDVVPSHDLLDAGYFGLGPAHPALRQRIGDFTLLMKDNYIIKDRLINEKPFHMIGVHGGLSSKELYIPLIIWE